MAAAALYISQPLLLHLFSFIMAPSKELMVQEQKPSSKITKLEHF